MFAGGPLSSADTISLLTHGRLFTEAVRLARLFEQPIAPILQGLAHTCIHPQNTLNKANTQDENGILSECSDFVMLLMHW